MNCAGIGGSQRTVGKDGVYPLAKFVRIINVNLIGLSTCCGCSRSGWRPKRLLAKSAASSSTPPASRPMRPDRPDRLFASKGGVVGLTLPAAVISRA